MTTCLSMMSRTAGSVVREGVVDSDPEAIAALALIRKVICLAAELSGAVPRTPWKS